MTEPPRSQHPADGLIRELIATGRDVSDEEAGIIRQRLATPLCSIATAWVPTEHRELRVSVTP